MATRKVPQESPDPIVNVIDNVSDNVSDNEKGSPDPIVNVIDNVSDNKKGTVSDNGAPEAETIVNCDATGEFFNEIPPPPGYDGNLQHCGVEESFGSGVSNCAAYESDSFSDGCCGDSGDEGGWCGSEGCGARCGGNCDANWNCCLDCMSSIYHSCKDYFTIHSGAHGFQSPSSITSSSFGFHEGLNLAIPWGPCHRWGWQLGFEGVHSNFSEAQVDGNFFNRSAGKDRDQFFVTTGFYRRSNCGPQFGVVWDYLNDSWGDEINLAQIRGEVSWVGPSCHELGFWFAVPTTDDNIGLDEGYDLEFESTEIYAFFYRYTARCGGEGRVYAGWSGDEDVVVGADIEVPIHNRWALRSDLAYLIPDRTDSIGIIQESWNVGVSVVFYPGGSARAGYCCLNRPLFRVANNGSFFIARP